MPLVVPKTGAEPFHNGTFLLKRTLRDFWRWSASDLVGNALRGILAEYIVATALDLPQAGRVEWEAFDLVTPGGLTLEVKSAAYVQAWVQKALSKIKFGIAPTRAFEAVTNDRTGPLKRQADVYVFCLLHHQDRATVDPLDMAHWTFYVLPTAASEQQCPTQKSIVLASLLRMKPCHCAYEELAKAIESIGETYDNHH